MHTTTASTPAPDPTIGPIDDPRPIFARAVAIAGPVVAGVRPDQLDGPTPCVEFDVRTLLGHLTGALRRVGVLGRGLNLYDHPAATPGVPDDGWPAVWSATSREVERIWQDDALLARTYELPWATLPGPAVLATYTAEITLHTWDVAVATDQQVEWDDEVVAFALAAMQQALPAEGRTAHYEAVAATLPPEAPPMSAPFGEALEVAAAAPTIDRLVAWCGRSPHGS
jgi:uncharacterized protein (TIGR03086 family)